MCVRGCSVGLAELMFVKIPSFAALAVAAVVDCRSFVGAFFLVAITGAVFVVLEFVVVVVVAFSLLL